MSMILLINSEPVVSDVVQHALPDNFRLLRTDTMQSAHYQTWRETPDLIIIDATHPGQDSLDMCHELRSMSNITRTPIMVLINGKTAHEVAQLLDAGADDCMRKPLAARELAARVRALLRRTSRPRSESLLTLNPFDNSVHIGGRWIELTPTEYQLLDELCQHPGVHLSTSKLLERVWHYPPGTGDAALVRNHVRNLRRKLEGDPDRPRVITCYQGRGYTISAQIRKLSAPRVF